MDFNGNRVVGLWTFEWVDTINDVIYLKSSKVKELRNLKAKKLNPYLAKNVEFH
jgi:hypothetical protein